MDQLDSYILINEFFGTMILAIAISSSFILDQEGNVLGSNKFVLISIVFTAKVFMLRLGGTDYNPGLTFMKLITYKDKEKLKFMNRIILPSIIMQTIGAICGFLMSYYFRNGFVFKLCIHKDSSPAAGFFVEIFCTFFLFLIVLIVDDSEVEKSSDVMKVIVVVAGIITGISLGGNISGAGMNPAIGFGANFAIFLVTGNLSELKYLWIYLIGPFISSYLASAFFLAVYKNNQLTEEKGSRKLILDIRKYLLNR